MDSELWSWLGPLIAGIVGGSISALIVTRVNRSRWEKVATSFKTTARLIADNFADPAAVPKYDEDGWLSDLVARESITEQASPEDKAEAETS